MCPRSDLFGIEINVGVNPHLGGLQLGSVSVDDGGHSRYVLLVWVEVEVAVRVGGWDCSATASQITI